MCIEAIISQLESIRANSASLIDPRESNSVWKKDIEALDETIAMLKGMERQNWWKRLLFRIQYLFSGGFRWIGGWK